MFGYGAHGWRVFWYNGAEYVVYGRIQTPIPGTNSIQLVREFVEVAQGKSEPYNPLWGDGY